MTYLTQNWSFDPFVVVVACIVVLHERGLANLRRRSAPERTRRRRLRSLLFYAGLGVILLAVTSPIDHWADDYFFVHMIEHILLSFFAPILIVAGAPWLPLLHGIPIGLRRILLRWALLGRFSRSLRTIGRSLVNPWTALVSFNTVMVLWHVPTLFDAAEENRVVHVGLWQSSFIVTGVLFWLQIIPSHPFRLKAGPLWQIGAILSTNVVMFFIAMSLSLFAQSSWYPVYDHLSGVTLAPFADQQIGAAILWICGDFWAVPVLAVIIRRAIDDKGGFAMGVDRLIHRAPDPTLEAFRASSTTEAAPGA